MTTRYGNEAELSAKEIYKEIAKESSTYQAEIEGKKLLFHNASNVLSLNPIEKFVELIINSEDIGYKRTGKTIRNGKSIVEFKGLALKLYFKKIRSFILTVYSHESFYIYSEHVILFMEACKELQLSSDMFYDCNFYFEKFEKYEAELFNDLIILIRSKSRTEEFKKKVSNRKSNSTRMFKSITDYIEGLFAQRSRLLVIRIDLGYLVSVDGCGEFRQNVTLEQVTADFDRFIRNMRHNSIFKNLYGYIWKLEYGEQKGYHYHLILFFKGSEQEKDVHIGFQVGNYWMKNITSNRGIFFNCNAKKGEYTHLGIGMIDINAESYADLRFNLNYYVVQYFTKNEQYLKIKLTEKYRVIGKGEVPMKSNNAGRPRLANRVEQVLIGV